MDLNSLDQVISEKVQRQKENEIKSMEDRKRSKLEALATMILRIKKRNLPKGKDSFQILCVGLTDEEITQALAHQHIIVQKISRPVDWCAQMLCSPPSPYEHYTISWEYSIPNLNSDI